MRKSVLRRDEFCKLISTGKWMKKNCQWMKVATTLTSSPFFFVQKGILFNGQGEEWRWKNKLLWEGFESEIHWNWDTTFPPLLYSFPSFFHVKWFVQTFHKHKDSMSYMPRVVVQGEEGNWTREIFHSDNQIRDLPFIILNGDRSSNPREREKKKNEMISFLSLSPSHLEFTWWTITYPNLDQTENREKRALQNIIPWILILHWRRERVEKSISTDTSHILGSSRSKKGEREERIWLLWQASPTEWRRRKRREILDDEIGRGKESERRKITYS